MSRWETVNILFLWSTKLMKCTFLKADWFKDLKSYSFLIELLTSILNFEETSTITIHQEKATEATINDINETINSLINIMVDFVANWCFEEEMIVKQWHIDNNFIDLRKRDFKDLNHELDLRWWVTHVIETLFNHAFQNVMSLLQQLLVEDFAEIWSHFTTLFSRVWSKNLEHCHIVWHQIYE